MPKPKRHPTVRIKPSSYVPTKAELEEDMGVPVDPETLGRMIIGDRKAEVEGED